MVLLVYAHQGRMQPVSPRLYSTPSATATQHRWEMGVLFKSCKGKALQEDNQLADMSHAKKA
jgi:hypothetical protein